MNNKSIKQNGVIKQQSMSSWIGDPFELNLAAKGNSGMTKNINVADYAEELAYTYGDWDGNDYALSLELLPYECQLELARCYIESTNRDLSECIYGDDLSINSEFTCALMRMLADNSETARQEFAEITQQNILKYYQSDLQDILDNACYEYHCALMNEQGYYERRDQEYGDYSWCRY